MMRILKQKWFFLLVFLFASFGLATYYFLPDEHAAVSVDTWIMKQVSKTIQRYIEPELSFTRFNYEYPNRFHLYDAKLTADGNDILKVGELKFTLTNIPKAGEPFIIDNVEINTPEIRLIEKSEQGDLVGFSHFIKSKPKKVSDVETKQTNNASESHEKVISQSNKQSIDNVFQINQLTIAGGVITYEPLGEEKMLLDQINLSTKIQPVENQANQYRLNVLLDKAPLFTMKSNASFDMGSQTLVIDELKWDIDVLRPESIQTLPPQVQKYLKEYEAKGAFHLAISGNVPLQKAKNAKISSRLTIDHFNIKVDEYKFPVSQATIFTQYKEGLVSFNQTNLSTLGGKITFPKATINTTQPSLPAVIQWQVNNLNLEEILARTNGNPKFAGKLDTSGYAEILLEKPQSSASGTGQLDIVDGKLVNIPVISEVSQALSAANVINFVKGKGVHNDKLDATFNLMNDRVLITTSKLETPALIARTKGSIAYTGDLDLVVNAGPIQKITNMFGDIGKLIDKATSKLIQYKVTGTVEDPKVRPKVLGL